MAQKEFFLTKEGLAKLEAELNSLRGEKRQQVAAKIQKAKEMGGTVNNAEYEDAKNEQAFVEGHILELENTFKNATIIPASSSAGRVTLGSTVIVHNQDGKVEHYTIVGSAEANPNDGKISNASPVGRALLGKALGATVQVAVPAGTLKLRIVEIKIDAQPKR